MSKKKEPQYIIKPYNDVDDIMQIEVDLDNDDCTNCNIMSNDGEGKVVKIYRPACANEVYLEESLILAVAEYIKEQRKK